MNNYCSNNMCYHNFQIPQNNSTKNFRNTNIPSYETNMMPNYSTVTNNGYQGNDDRFFFAPFLVGGLAGTALGYGIANNNQIKGGYYMPPPPVYYYPSPMPYTNNYYYY